MTDTRHKQSPRDYLSHVRAQYEAYPFPKRDPAEERKRLHISEYDYLARINHYCFGGRCDFRNEFRTLVAGGGTGDATIFLAEQLRRLNGQVVYLDMSEASLSIAKERAKVRGLTNITWVNASILDLPNLDLGKFDYISCTGVLHHLADPMAGLQALAGILKDDGGMCLMVYGRYGRRDIYMMQDLVRLIFSGEPDLEARVRGVTTLLRSLPRSHPFFHGQNPDNWLAKLTEDKANLFDIFLHEQDRPYSVPEIYDWLHECGLKLVAFTNYQRKTPIYRMQYDPAYHVQDEDLLATIRERPLNEQQAIAEIIDGNIGLHTFYVSRRENAAAELSPAMIPFFSFEDIAEFARNAANQNAKKLTLELWTGKNVHYACKEYTLPILGVIDGNLTCAQIIDSIGRDAEEPALMRELQRVFEFFNSLDWMLLRHGTAPGFAPLPMHRTP